MDNKIHELNCLPCNYDYVYNNIQYRILTSEALANFKSNQAFVLNQIVNNKYNWPFSEIAKEGILYIYNIMSEFIFCLEQKLLYIYEKNQSLFEIIDKILDYKKQCFFNFLDKKFECSKEKCIIYKKNGCDKKNEYINSIKKIFDYKLSILKYKIQNINVENISEKFFLIVKDVKIFCNSFLFDFFELDRYYSKLKVIIVYNDLQDFFNFEKLLEIKSKILKDATILVNMKDKDKVQKYFKDIDIM